MRFELSLPSRAMLVAGVAVGVFSAMLGMTEPAIAAPPSAPAAGVVPLDDLVKAIPLSVTVSGITSTSAPHIETMETTQGNVHVTQVHATYPFEYTPDNVMPPRVSIELQSTVIDGIDMTAMAMTGAQNLNHVQTTEEGYEKVYSLGKDLYTEKWRKGTEEGESLADLTVVVGGSLNVTVAVGRGTMEDAKTIFSQIQLTQYR